jgi:hypothetical protein
MKTKTMYVADDGTPFASMQQCIFYEKSTSKYTVTFLNERGEPLSNKDFDSEAKAKRFIADALHRCFRNEFISRIKLSHLGTAVEFKSTELGEVVPTHLKINGEKLNEVFQKAKIRNIHL